MDKRGEEHTEIFFAIFSFVAVSAFLVVGVIQVNKTVDNTLVEQDFAAKEIATVIGEMSSGLGDIKVELSFKRRVTISINDGFVNVKEADLNDVANKNNLVGVDINAADLGVDYPIVRNNLVEIEDNTIRNTNNLVLTKQGRRIFAYAK